MYRPPFAAFPVIVLAIIAPTSAPAQSVSEAKQLAGGGDTAAALAMLEDVIDQNERNAEAHFVAGRLLLAQQDPNQKVSASRRKAEEHLRYATRFEPDSAKYWIALADLFRSANVSTLRMQVNGLVRKAEAAARKAGEASELAEAQYRIARAAWERYEHYGRRYAPLEAGRAAAVPRVFAEWRYWQEFLDHGVREVPVANADLAEAEDLLWKNRSTHPSDVRSTGLLIVLLGETYRWEETVPVARHLVRAAPDSGRAWALLGLAYARTDRWPEATAAFDTAFAHMSHAQRAPYRNLGQIMRRADRIQWEQATGAERAALDSLYWRVAQPLVLTGTNEVQAEFYARITYTEHRWTDEWRGFQGYDTDIGAVYVRFGPPDIWMVFGRRSIVWVYAQSHFRFQFTLTPGYTRARFAGQSREGLRVAQEESPARFDNIPLYRTLDTILVQVAQFRGAGDSTAVAVFGAIPIARMTDSIPVANLPLVTGAVVTDDNGHPLQRDRRQEVVRDAGPDGVINRSWRLALDRGSYLLRAEAYVAPVERGARGMEALEVRSYRPGPLDVSDILVAGRVAPRDSAPARWTDFLIEPNGGRFLPGDSVAILWENYNLQRDSTGAAHIAVDLRFTVDAIERHSLFAQVVGGVADAVGLSAKGDDQAVISYERSATVPPTGILPEYLTVDLRDAPEGRYTVALTVTDLLAGTTATRERTLLVSREPPSRAPAPTSFR
jgi:GWxTD domain-containing protein